MADSYILSECHKLLHTNPKTFQRWLTEAGIDSEKQKNLSDPRKKMITKAQLQMIAQTHGITLPTLDERASPETSPLAQITELLAPLQPDLQRITQVDQKQAVIEEQIDTLRQEFLAARAHSDEMTQWTQTRLEEIHLLLQQILTLLEQHPLPSHVSTNEVMEKQQEQARPTSSSSTITTTSSTPLSSSSVPPSNTPTSSSSASKRPTTSSAKKKQAKGKKFPPNLVLLRDFAKQHTIETERASDAGKAGKLPIVRGRWLINSRWANEALDAQGRQQFYEVFHTRSGFTPCEHCPHT